MAQIIENFPGRSYTRGSTIDEEWFDGRPRKLTRGEDFQAAPTSVRMALYKKAKELGKAVRVSIEKTDEGEFVYMVARVADENPAPRKPRKPRTSKPRAEKSQDA